jgi:hypothetical protein
MCSQRQLGGALPEPDETPSESLALLATGRAVIRPHLPTGLVVSPHPDASPTWRPSHTSPLTARLA